MRESRGFVRFQIIRGKEYLAFIFKISIFLVLEAILLITSSHSAKFGQVD